MIFNEMCEEKNLDPVALLGVKTDVNEFISAVLEEDTEEDLTTVE